MFSIFVEDTFEISSRRYLILMGKTSGDIKKGDYLFEINNRSRSYKVLGIEMIHYRNIEDICYDNLNVMVELPDCELPEFIGKTLISE